MNSLNKQRGLGYIGWLLTIAGIGVAIVLGLRIIPPYVQHVAIVQIIESLQSEPDISRKTTGQIRKMIRKRFEINMMTTVSTHDLKISKKKDKVMIELNYQVQKPIFGNADILITFSDLIEIEP